MTTPSNLKARFAKKTVPVKWQDRAWSPRIITRFVDRRMERRAFGQRMPGLARRYAASELIQCLRGRGPARAGRRSLSDTRRGFPNLSLPLPVARLRSFRASSSDNAL